MYSFLKDVCSHISSDFFNQYSWYTFTTYSCLTYWSTVHFNLLSCYPYFQCEFYSGGSRHGSRVSLNSLSAEERNTHKANFKDFENEMISQLDHMVMEGGKGDGMYKDKFRDILMNQCEQHMALKDLGTVFVATVTRLMELLLEYRSIRQEESRDNQMSCIVNLLEFYNEHRREEMFIRHLKKLYDLHMECENWAEAGFTLEKQTNVNRIFYCVAYKNLSLSLSHHD